MRIGFNAQILTDGRSGVARYARNVIRLLPILGKDHEFVVFGNSEVLKNDEKNVILVPTSTKVNSSSKRILWEQLILPKLIKKYNLDLMFYPDHTCSLWLNKVAQVIVLHDLTPFAKPQTFSTSRRLYKQYAIKRSVEKAKVILADSYATKSEALRYFKNIEQKINVVHLGIEHSIRASKRKGIAIKY